MCASNDKECHGKFICKCEEYGPRLEGLIIPSLLMLLKENSSHGYEIIEKLNEFDFLKTVPDPGAVYRHLRRMEEEGLVQSRLEAGGAGPARKVYSLTEYGDEYLLSCTVSVNNIKKSIEKFLSAVKDFKDLEKS